MQKDFKIGMALGLLPVIAAALWLSTRPSLSTKERYLRYRQPETTHDRVPSRIFSRLGSQDTPDISIVGVDKLQQPAQSNPVDFARRERTKDYESNKRPAASNKQRETRFHIIREDDTLYGISNRYYGSANKWQKIFDANRRIIKDANKLKPGTKLIIPW